MRDALAAAGLWAAAAAAIAAAGGQRMREVNEVLALVPDSAHGAQIFTYCASCHTESVNRLPEGWVPKIAGQHPRYLVRQLIDYRHSVRWDARMEPVAQGHGVRGLQDIADVVAYVASQPAEWGGEAKAVSGNGRTFYDDHCSGCHGSGGEGSDARLVPRIAGQDFAYVLRQLHDVVDGRRPNMRASHLRALEDLDVVQLVELSGYVSSLRAHATAGAASLTRSQGAARVGDSS